MRECQNVSGLIFLSWFDKDYSFMLNIIINPMSQPFKVPETKQSMPSRGLDTSHTIWLQQKSQKDAQLWGNSQHLWIVENKIYDLTAYANRHPGGKQWINLTKGQDITELFITHHLNQERARESLKKFYVRDVEKPLNQRYTFEPQGLYRRVKSGLVKMYEPKKLQNWSKSVQNGYVFLAIWLILFILTASLQSYILAILCGLSMFPILGVAHNFVHMKHHPFRYLWLITGFTHEEWQIMHCLSHHIYTNTLLDYEIQALEPVAYFLKISPKNKWVFGIVKEMLLPFGTFSNILLKTIIVPIVKKTKPDIFYLSSLIQIPFIYLMTNNLFTALTLYAVMHITVSAYFLKMTFISHRNSKIWTQGNQQIRDFAEHQVYTCADTITNDETGFLSYLKYAGFNFHAIHHLFPTIDNHYLPLADKILAEESKKLGINRLFVHSIASGLMDVQSNFYNRKQWRRQ